MSQTSLDRKNSRRVRTHEENSGETVRWLGIIIQSIFVSNQETTAVWIFGNTSVRVGTQGLFRPYLKTFVPPFFPTRLTAPGSLRMGGYAIYCRNAQVLEMQNFLPGLLVGIRTDVHPWRTIFPEPKFLGSIVTKFSYPCCSAERAKLRY